MSVTQHYPKWIYGKAASKLVTSVTEHKAAGPGWYESPADVPADGAAPAAPDPATVQKFYTTPPLVIVQRVQRLATVAEVEQVAAIEQQRQPAPRPSVLKAVMQRLVALTGAAGDSPHG
jgi:hypothetical protein